MTSVRSNDLSLKFYRLTPSGTKYKSIRQFEFGAKPQFPLSLRLAFGFKSFEKKPSYSIIVHLRNLNLL